MMELLRQVSSTQFFFPATAVAVVLVCAALVFMFGFHTAEPPQFDKLPLIIDERKSSQKKKKIKEKKSSPNRTSSDESRAKSESKKSPVKEKKEEVEKPKPKEKIESKPTKKVVVPEKKVKKSKIVEVEIPADFDDGLWEEVPKKSEKKKVKGIEKESPVKKSKKNKVKENGIDATVPPVEEPAESQLEDQASEDHEETIKVISAVGPDVDEDAARALQAQVEELQRVLKEAERRDQGLSGPEEEDEAPELELTEVKDLRSNKKKENKEKQSKKKEAVAKSVPKSDDNSDTDKHEENTSAPVFDELGDTWTEANVSKKSKKKARKDQ